MSKITEDIKKRYMGEVLGYDEKKYREEIKKAAEENAVEYADDFSKYYEEDALIQDPTMMAAKPDNNNKLIIGIIVGVIILGTGSYFGIKYLKSKGIINSKSQIKIKSKKS